LHTGIGSVFASASECKFNLKNPLNGFKSCSPIGVIQEKSKPNFDVTNAGGDFMRLIQIIVERAQLVTFFLAVALIVWIGLLMIVPGNAEAKEATKGKLISVLLGFLAMLSATIIINILINSLYGLFQ
jgi:RsiW-degrading membrane proteinase PrsW (M82 family)